MLRDTVSEKYPRHNNKNSVAPPLTAASIREGEGEDFLYHTEYIKYYFETCLIKEISFSFICKLVRSAVLTF